MKAELWAGVVQGGGCKTRRSSESFAWRGEAKERVLSK